mgnify:CR=1 FL=1
MILQGIDEAVGADARRQVRGHEFVKSDDAMAAADLTGVLRVIIEVLFGEQAVLVADEAVGSHLGRIELDLHFHILRDGDERAGHLLDEHFACLGEAVDVGVVAVPFVGEGFHGTILQIAAAKAEHAEEDAAASLLRDEFLQLRRIADADIEVAIGAEDDAVDAIMDESGHRLLVGELQAARAVRASIRLELIHGGDDAGTVFTIRGRQDDLRAAGVGDHRDAVALAHLLG